MRSYVAELFSLFDGVVSSHIIHLPAVSLERCPLSVNRSTPLEALQNQTLNAENAENAEFSQRSLRPRAFSRSPFHDAGAHSR